jgi:hypothetical protein
MQADDAFGTGGGACNCVKIERRGIARKERLARRPTIKRLENLTLGAQVLKHRLNEEIRLAGVLQGVHNRKRGFPLRALVLRDTLLLYIPIDSITHGSAQFVARFGSHLDYRNRQICIEEREGDPSPHKTAPHDADRAREFRLERQRMRNTADHRPSPSGMLKRLGRRRHQFTHARLITNADAR